MALRAAFLTKQISLIGVRAMSSEWGSGAGKGGGTGGSVRDAGGAFGKMEAAHEEQYFRKLREQQLKELRQHLEEEVIYHEKEIREHQQAEQMADLKVHLDEEIIHHEHAIKQHQESIERHKKRMAALHESEKKMKKGKGDTTD